MLVWPEDEFTPNLGKVQVAPWETESQCSFSCRRCLLRGEEPEELISPRSGFALGFLPHHGARGSQGAQGCAGMLGGERSRPRGRAGLAAGCTVLAGLREDEWGSSRAVQRWAGSGRKQMHTDLQWPSRVLHGTVTVSLTATPGTGTSPEAPLLPLPLQVSDQELMCTVRGPVEKQRDVEELLLSSLLQWPVPQAQGWLRLPAVLQVSGRRQDSARPAEHCVTLSLAALGSVSLPRDPAASLGRCSQHRSLEMQINLHSPNAGLGPGMGSAAYSPLLRTGHMELESR